MILSLLSRVELRKHRQRRLFSDDVSRSSAVAFGGFCEDLVMTHSQILPKRDGGGGGSKN